MYITVNCFGVLCLKKIAMQHTYIAIFNVKYFAFSFFVLKFTIQCALIYVHLRSIYVIMSINQAFVSMVAARNDSNFLPVKP